MRATTFKSRCWRVAAATGLLASLSAVPAAAAAHSASAAPIPKSVQITSATASGTSSGLAPGSIKHVWLIILENKSYDASFTGLNQNTELWKTLPSQGVLLKNYYGTGHYSQDNYETLVSGQAPQQDTQSDCDVAYKDFPSTVVTSATSPNYGQAASNVGPYTGVANDPAADGKNGCVYPASVPTLFNQFDANGTSWKGYAQDAGNQAGREDLACYGPGSSTVGNNPTSNPTNEQSTSKPAGVTSYTGAQANDQYVAKHFPFPWFHSLIDNATDCNASHIASLDSTSNGLVHDLQNNTVPNFSWITPNNCSDAHDAVCAGNNLSGAFNANGTPNYSAGTPYYPQSTTPTNFTGGLYASDLFLKYYIPLIEGSQAFKQGGLIDVTFDEGNPPFVNSGGQSFNNADQYVATSADKPNAANALAADAAGENINGQNVNTEPAGPNTPLGTNANGAPDPGPGDNGFIDRTPAGSRTDTAGVSGIQGQTVITDNKISEYDNGRSVTGPNIPGGAFVSAVSDTGPLLSPSSSSAGGTAVLGSFSLVDASGNPLTPFGPVSSVTLGAETTTTDPLYDANDPTPGGGDTGSVLISPFITPGTSTSTYYNHYSWLRTMEDLFNVSSGTSTAAIPGGAGTVSGGLDGLGHIGYAAQSGLAAFGPDVFNNPAGTTLPPVSTPEAPLAIGLPAAAALVLGGFVFYRHRKQRQVTSA